MRQRLAVLAINAVSIGALLGLLTAGLAIAGTPFGGDDSGFIPPNRDVASCEDSVGKELGKAAACILGCHKQASGGRFAPMFEDFCENDSSAFTCKAKYDAVTGNSSKLNVLCPPCLNATNRANLFDTVEGILDANNNRIYCAGTTPWGGEDTGFFAPDRVTKQCEDRLGKAARKAIGCIIKCHKARAAGKLADDIAEDNCEKGNGPSCRGKYDRATQILHCDPCLDKPGLFTFIETTVDNMSGAVYCASPSGAFLD